MSNLIYGVGVNDIPYPTQRTGYVDGKRRVTWICPFYDKWMGMLERSYSVTFKQKNPWYIEVSSVDQWKHSSNFKSWMEQQDWQDKELDKDLLVPGNKIYGPDTCLFVESRVNKFIIDSKATRGELPIGVYFDSRRSKFMARCRNGDSQKFLGYFESADLAYKAWLKEKLRQARILAEQQTDSRAAQALVARYENYLPS